MRNKKTSKAIILCNIISILITIYFIICYVDIIMNNTSKESAERLLQHDYNIIVQGIKE